MNKIIQSSVPTDVFVSFLPCVLVNPLRNGFFFFFFWSMYSENQGVRTRKTHRNEKDGTVCCLLEKEMNSEAAVVTWCSTSEDLLFPVMLATVPAIQTKAVGRSWG